MNHEKMLEALLEVRDSGECNMLDIECVYQVMVAYDYPDEALAWKKLPSGRKMSLLKEMGKLVQARAEESSFHC